jgi:F-type H+-transporting ATPase subunit delta
VIGNVVARRYAKALVDILTEREGDFDAVHAEIEGLASIVEGSRDLTRLLYSPSIRLEVKRGIVEDLIARTGLSEISSTFVRLLLEKGRLRYLTSIAETFEYLANERRGRLKVNLTSSAPLGDDVVERLKAEIEASTGKTILIETAVDPALIGGLVVRIGDRVLDGSIKHQLAAMRESLVRG